MKKQTEYSKLEAARSQVDTAIKLFFLNECPVSVHTLTSASYNILYDVSKHANSDFHFEMDVWIKPEYLKLFRKKVNEAANFFKHADQDPNEKIVFEEAVNELKLFQCCRGYADLTKDFSPAMSVFAGWMKLYYTSLFKLEENELETIRKAFQGNGIDPENRETSLQIGLLLLKQRGLLSDK